MAKITVDPKYCKGCELCMTVCPKKIIKIGTTLNSSGQFCVGQTDSEKCTACKLCAIVCPDSAITVYQ